MKCPTSVVALVLHLLFSNLQVIFAQNFTPPDSWQNTQSSLSLSQRQTIAWETAQELQSHIASSGTIDLPEGVILPSTTIANVAIVLASQDWLAGNTTWESAVTSLLSSGYEDQVSYNGDLAYYGLAELNAYLAYKDNTHLDKAVDNWNEAYSDLITNSARQNVNYPRNISATGCGGTLGGMLFDVHADAASQLVSAWTISSWIAFSSRLADITKNETYFNAAALSIQFVQLHLLNPGNTSNLVSDTWNAVDCTASGTSVTWDVGPFIEGLSIVAAGTSDPSYKQTLLELVSNATLAWTNTQGVITEQINDYRKGTMLRGLLEAKRQDPANTAMGKLIDDYITIQFNAVQKNAGIGDANYATNWVGPNDSSDNYNYAGSVEALNVFNSAFAILQPNDGPVSKSSHHTPIGAIVGGAVGGAMGVFAIVIAVFLYLRRRRRTREMPVREDKFELATPTDTQMILEPYVPMSSTPSRPQLSSKGGSDSYMNPGATIPIEHQHPQSVHTPAAETDGSSPVLVGLARRLDHLISTLAIRSDGAAESPPEYDASHSGSHGVAHAR